MLIPNTSVDSLKTLLFISKKVRKNVFWGVAPTGPIQLGYLDNFRQLIQLGNIGFEVKILIASFHGYLDDLKSGMGDSITLEIADYYREVFEIMGLDLSFTNYVYSHKEYLNESYFLELIKNSNEFSVHDSMSFS